MEKNEMLDVTYIQKYINELINTDNIDNKKELVRNLLYISERLAARYGVLHIHDRLRASE